MNNRFEEAFGEDLLTDGEVAMLRTILNADFPTLIQQSAGDEATVDRLKILEAFQRRVRPIVENTYASLLHVEEMLKPDAEEYYL